MRKIKKSQLNSRQVVRIIESIMKNEISPGSYIEIEKVYDQDAGWKITGGIIEK